jgi:hypothetical protein
VLVTGGRDLDHPLQSTELLVATVRAHFAPRGPMTCVKQGHDGGEQTASTCRSGVP